MEKKGRKKVCGGGDGVPGLGGDGLVAAGVPPVPGVVLVHPLPAVPPPLPAVPPGPPSQAAGAPPGPLATGERAIAPPVR